MTFQLPSLLFFIPSFSLSEIILQQTSVDQGLPYFIKFSQNYPSVGGLARANEDEVLLLWQGLGYYSRARNMLKTAKFIVDHHSSEFPNTYNDLLKLQGIGPYTAAAIASFAFKEPTAVVDGNVQILVEPLTDDTLFHFIGSQNLWMGANVMGLFLELDGYVDSVVSTENDFIVQTEQAG